MLPGKFDGELDAMNGRRKTGDEQPPFGARENLIEFPTNGSFTGRINVPLHVSGILQQGQNAFLAVFGKSVQVKQAIVSGRWIYLEVAGMNHNSQWVWMANDTQSTRLCVT